MATPSLREIQREFWASIAIAQPHDVAQFTPALMDLVMPGPHLAAARRIKVYADAYWLRLRDVLQEDFPVTAARLGADRFEQLVRDYLHAFPSEHPSVRHLGRAMAEFVERQQDLPPCMGDLARLEWAMIEVFDAADADPIGLDTLAGVAAERWPELRFAPIPALTVLHSRWPVHRLWESGGPAALEPSSTTIRVWRDRDYRVFHAAIDSRETEALDQMRSGRPFAAICGAYADLSAEEAAREATMTLARWLECGIIAGPV